MSTGVGIQPISASRNVRPAADQTAGETRRQPRAQGWDAPPAPCHATQAERGQQADMQA